MPVYEFRCPTCSSVFEQRRSMAESDAPASCPEGHPGARRMLSVFASVSSDGSAPAASAPGPAAGSCGGACVCH